MDHISRFPLVVDLDGTLTRTDTLFESVIQLIKKNPFSIFVLLWALFQGRAEFKNAVSARVNISVDTLPYCIEFLDFVREQKKAGRRIILATATHSSIASMVAEHLGLFDDVIATDGSENIKGEKKLAAIRARVGTDFCYAGDSRADLPVWQGAQSAVLVGVAPSVAALVHKNMPVEREFSHAPAGWRVWLRALRVHQWVKNVLLFVPVMAAFGFFGFEALLNLGVAFFSFSFAASATYIVNDLWDLDNDRRHPRKRHRPFASAQISIQDGVGAAISLLATSFFMAWWVSETFALVLLLYVMLTSVYSWMLKSYVLLDVLTLSLLYTVRIVAGGVVTATSLSYWLLAFSIFFFLSLALVKRCAELRLLEKSGASGTKGRDYQTADLVVLWPMGMSAAIAAVVVFGLFIHAPETKDSYGTPEALWFVAFAMIYWLGRLWLKTARGEMHDDPVVYAAKDRGSRLTLLAMLGFTLLARFVSQGTFI